MRCYTTECNKGGGIITINVERFRNEHNLTQKELADKLNVSQGTISMIENGDRNPSVDLLLRIASVFNITVDELISKAG